MTRDADGTSFPTMEIARRIDRVRSRFDACGCEALLVTKSENVRYLTGFSGSAGMLFVGPDKALLVTDGRYRDQAPMEVVLSAAPADVTIGRPEEQFAAVVAAAGVTRLGLESTAASWALKRRVADLFPRTLVATRGVVEAERVVKDEGELARIARACEIADLALAQLKSRFAEGVTENDFAAELEYEMRRRGASAPAFETIVASGPNSALPHARPTSRRMVEGDLVVVDFGSTVEGYRSDMTRTFYLGDPDPKTVELLDAVFAAQRAGLSSAHAGMTAGEIDAACRTSLDQAGYGEVFTHSTGHGVGLEIHESPAVSAGSADNLPVNTVIAIEPGAYLAGRGGVRIEDTVVVTNAGVRALTHSTKDYTP